MNEKELKQYLQVFRSKKDIENEFNLSNTESWHTLKWYIKLKCIECVNLTGIVKKKGIVKVYRWIEK